MIGIYKITNPDGQVYIGRSKNIPIRFKSYKYSEAKNQPKLRDSFIDHGIKNHRFEIICECKPNELRDFELFFINKYDAVIKGLNSQMPAYFLESENEPIENPVEFCMKQIFLADWSTGKKPGRKKIIDGIKVQIKCTDYEYVLIRELLAKMRESKSNNY